VKKIVCDFCRSGPDNRLRSVVISDPLEESGNPSPRFQGDRFQVKGGNVGPVLTGRVRVKLNLFGNVRANEFALATRQLTRNLRQTLFDHRRDGPEVLVTGVTQPFEQHRLRITDDGAGLLHAMNGVFIIFTMP
jgi:hypothetical protein